VTIRLVLDPIACDGHGLCAEVFPEGITLDDWGYPMLREGDVPRHLEQHARRAASACPVLALRVRRAR
jgi:ferredoxin